MNNKTKALLFNLICFGTLFLTKKPLSAVLFQYPIIPLVVFSTLLASIFSPKFLLEIRRTIC